MKKDIISKYSELINDMSIAHDNIVNDLRFHINLLQKRVYELEGKDVTAELEEYDKLESLEKRVAELTKRNKELEALLKKAKTPTNTTKKVAKKTKLITCQRCGKGFFARNRRAKYCANCKRLKMNAYQRKYRSKKSKEA